MTPALAIAATEQTEAERVAAICARELSGNRWSEDARGDLREIRCAAIGAMDHDAGHEGFEGARAEMERRLADWADDVDYRMFPRLTDTALVAHSKNQRQFYRHERRAVRKAVA